MSVMAPHTPSRLPCPCPLGQVGYLGEMAVGVLPQCLDKPGPLLGGALLAQDGKGLFLHLEHGARLPFGRSSSF